MTCYETVPKINGGVQGHAAALGKQCADSAEHKHTDRVPVGWKVLSVNGERCSGRPTTPLCAVPDDADADELINRNASKIHW